MVRLHFLCNYKLHTLFTILVIYTIFLSSIMSNTPRGTRQLLSGHPMPAEASAIIDMQLKPHVLDGYQTEKENNSVNDFQLIEKKPNIPENEENCSGDIHSAIIPASLLLNESASQNSFHPQTILVLGSGGLVGSALVYALQQKGYSVLEVKNRYDMDLRFNNALDPILNNNQIHFCFFLACEVGGSKFLSNQDMQLYSDFFSENMQNAVINSLRQRSIPFFFASSQLAINTEKTTHYAEVKKRGESLTLSNGGKVFRLWNVYGFESIGFKSHVVSDWIYQCMMHGQVQSFSNGWEFRRFMHVDNLAMTLISMMHKFHVITEIVDIAPEKQVTMRDLADLIKSQMPNKCEINFAEEKAHYQSSSDPVNLLPISGSLKCGILRTIEKYGELKNRKDQGEIYLSIIAGTTNDDYNKIRGRLFTFLHFLGEQLKQSSLMYEVILVQYNPRVTADYFNEEYTQQVAINQDLPLSQLIPLTSGTTALHPLRIITVPPEYHRFHDKGQFWEYVAKNVGVRASRGQFVMLTNPDNLFPSTLIGWLAKQQLMEKNFYQSGWISDEYRDQEMCDKISTNKGVCFEKGMCMSQEPSRNYCRDCLGDFTIFSREVFFSTGGYMEIPQNEHVESGHKHYIESTPVLRDLQTQKMDDVICHRNHDRNGRPVSTVTGGGISSLMHDRPIGSDWGISTHLNGFPEANLIHGDVWGWGYNPLTPFLLWRHHELFQSLVPQIASAPFDKNYHLDFAGTLTKYTYDCENWFRYRRWHLSRRIACDRMDVFASYDLGINFPSINVFGDLPVIDEEYFEWITLLHALHAWRTESRPFVIVEMGARYGTWAARGGVMAKRIRPDLGAKVSAIEGDSIAFQWLEEHMKVNGLKDTSILRRGVVGSLAFQDQSKQALQWEPGSSPDKVPIFTVIQLLEEHPVVDIIHVDIQGDETTFLEPEVIVHIKKHVRFLHIGTHGEEIFKNLKSALVDAGGWRVLHEFPAQPIIDTVFGPISLMHDGELALENMDLV
jgi:nucleoside-diphosphate-sugar epimerase